MLLFPTNIKLKKLNSVLYPYNITFNHKEKNSFKNYQSRIRNSKNESNYFKFSNLNKKKLKWKAKKEKTLRINVDKEQRTR